MILLFKLQILSDPDRIPLTYASVTFTNYRSAFSPTLPTLVNAKLLELLSARRDLGLFQATIGPTDAPRGTYLVETVNDNDSESCSIGNSDDESVTTLFESSLRGEINLDNIMMSAAHARRPKGIDAEHLSKTWRIDQKQAKRTLEITSQHSRRADDPTLSRNYGTNDRMLRYKRVSEYGHVFRHEEKWKRVSEYGHVFRHEEKWKRVSEYGHVFRHEEKWKIVPWTYLLSAFHTKSEV